LTDRTASAAERLRQTAARDPNRPKPPGVMIIEKGPWHFRIVGTKPRPDPPPAFVCPVCKTPSWHQKDAEHGFCARCNSFTG
jgi:hypothetical protein